MPACEHTFASSGGLFRFLTVENSKYVMLNMRKIDKEQEAFPGFGYYVLLCHIIVLFETHTGIRVQAGPVAYISIILPHRATDC